ncbi:hypothetical protein [Lentzea sp. NPDC059081]|uniref:transmembrane-type terpene cyclase n=1 Tax=Lentzea sp. NPDC059081 TaxID=3346719 RepID=UPI0036B6AA70
MDWLPPYLIPMSWPAPVAAGPAEVGWVYWLVAGPTALGWTLTYLLAIRQAVLDGRVGVPAHLVAVNFAWEFTLTFVLEQVPEQRPVNLLWCLLSGVLLYQAFRFGHADHPRMSPRAFRWSVAGVAVWAALAVLAAANEFHDTNGMYTGMIIQVPLSASFLFLLDRRGSSAGQSMHLAVVKLAGSVAAGLTAFLVYPGRYLFLVLVPTYVVLDIVYAVRLRRVMLAEGRAPWAWRMSGDEAGQIRPIRSA